MNPRILPQLIVASACLLLAAGSGRSEPPTAAAARPELSGETSKPFFNVFIPGEKIGLTFRVSGLPTGTTDAVIDLKIVDERGKTIDERRLVAPLEDGAATVETNAPCEKLGFYRVYATLSDGTALPATGSRGAGFITYAVTPDPASRPRYPMRESRFGMQGGFNGAVNPLPYLGVRWVNAGPTWRHEEPDHSGQFADKRAKLRKSGGTGPAALPGATRRWDWCRIDRDGTPEGWTIFPLIWLYDPPPWAYDAKTRHGTTAVMTPTGEEGWARFCREAAEAACEDYPNLEERVYQITWEPNWFNGSAEQFMAIYRIASKEIHAVDPKAVVIGPTKAFLERGSKSQEADWFKNGLGDCLDAYSLHPYVTTPPEKAGYAEAVRALRTYVRKTSGKDLPIFGTEQGCQSHDEMEEELPQARHIVRMHLISLGEGMRLNFGFYIHDCGIKGAKGSEPGYGYFHNLREDGRFGTDRISPKPVVPAFAAMTLLIDGSTPVGGAVNWLGETVTGYVFERGGELTVALWDSEAERREVDLPVGSEAVEVFDFMGNTLPAEARDGTLRVTLSPSPLYVRKVPQSIWGRDAKRPLALDETQATVTPGSTFVVKGTMFDPSAGAGVRHSLRVEGDGLVPYDMTVETAADGTASFECPVQTVAACCHGPRSVRVTAANASGDVLATAFMRVVIAPPVVIRSLAATRHFVGNAAVMDGINVTLSEMLGATQKVTVDVSIEGVGEWKQIAVVLPADGDETPKLPIPSDFKPEPARMYRARIQCVTDGGQHVEQTLPFGFMPLIKLDEDPVKRHWEQIPKVPLDLSAARDGTDVDLRMAWSTKNFHVRCEIPSAVAADDLSLIVDVNSDPGKFARFTGNAFADKQNNPRMAGMAIDVSGGKVSLRRITTSDPNGAPLGPLRQERVSYKKLYESAVETEKGRTVIEVAIPWAELAAPWPPQTTGSIIGIAARLQSRADGHEEQPVFRFFDALDASAMSQGLCTAVLVEQPRGREPFP